MACSLHREPFGGPHACDICILKNRKSIIPGPPLHPRWGEERELEVWLLPVECFLVECFLVERFETFDSKLFSARVTRVNTSLGFCWLPVCLMDPPLSNSMFWSRRYPAANYLTRKFLLHNLRSPSTSHFCVWFRRPLVHDFSICFQTFRSPLQAEAHQKRASCH